MQPTAVPNDPLLAKITSISWLILLNKPIYPLYVWYFVGEGVTASLLTIASVPLYAIVLLVARRSSLGARIAFPLIAAIDTACETKLFGAAAATEVFLAPAALIATLSFRASEVRALKAVLILLYVIFLITHGNFGNPLFPWTDAGTQHLRTINSFAAASLTLFVGWTFAGLRLQP